ncbi:MAG: transketolase [Armatimonadetes bacterium]|nr:transketolase [Armatimonadota bacterium]
MQTSAITAERVAAQARALILKTVHQSNAGHTGGALSMCEILAVLYFKAMNIDPARPDWPKRDRFILSKGHAAVGLYAILCLRGYFGEQCMCEFDHIDGRLQGHPDMLKTPGVDMSTGSLGQGLSAGIGMALGRDRRGMAFHVYVLLGDGELQEGQVWEAAMYAGHHKVRRLIAIIDYNQLQLTGWTRDTLDLDPLARKWESFGWNVLSCDGHSVPELINTIEKAKSIEDGPVVVIAKTLKGRGISFIEGNVSWHAKAPSESELEQALSELECAG